MRISKIFLKVLLPKISLVFLCAAVSLLDPYTVVALTADQKRVIDSGAYYFNITEDQNGSGNSCSLPGNDNQEKVWNYFINKPGYTPEITAGIIGNMMAESGVLPMRLQGRPPAEEYSSQDVEFRTDIGWGLVQWTDPGKMITPSRQENKSYEEINTVEHQVEFLWRQLEGTSPGNTSEKAAGNHLKQQTTVADAARSFMTKYERPLDQSESKIQGRIELAEEAYARLSSLSAGSGACTGSGNWKWPFDPSGTITSCFGPRSSPGGVGSSNHKGLDIANGGTGKILASDGGTVSYARTTDQGGYGIHIIIDHGNGYKTLYAHAERLYKNQGDSVSPGEHIADEGNTGTSTGDHLHFEIRQNENQINPLDELTIPSNATNRANCNGSAN